MKSQKAVTSNINSNAYIMITALLLYKLLRNEIARTEKNSSRGTLGGERSSNQSGTAMQKTVSRGSQKVSLHVLVGSEKARHKSVCTTYPNAYDAQRFIPAFADVGKLISARLGASARGSCSSRIVDQCKHPCLEPNLRARLTLRGLTRLWRPGLDGRSAEHCRGTCSHGGNLAPISHLILFNLSAITFKMTLPTNIQQDKFSEVRPFKSSKYITDKHRFRSEPLLRRPLPLERQRRYLGVNNNSCSLLV